ncbi:hypothetical protein [Micromonospora globispora]|uniref:hypothetical protein n=1 Tax=Micromonospora globispora TaxID=1450148 RepID=UPI003C6D87E0
MARRGWGASIATAMGVAAGTGAAQLGFGYGLGIINWTPAEVSAVDAAWVASLAWATWISATSVVAGAVCAQRLHERGVDDERGGTARKIALAVAGAVGALITVLLVAVPARAATVPDTVAPQNVAAGYAGVGLLAGVLIATWALHSRAAATNLIATVGWLWLLAVVSVVDGVLSGRGLTSAQLGIWQISADSDRFWIRDYFYWPGALLAMGSALVIGTLAARRTARLPQRRVGAAASGAAGPLLVAVAYLLAVPRLAAIAPEQVSAHLIAPYAVIVGLAGSVLMAALAQRADRSAAAARGGVSIPRQRTGEPEDLPTAHPGQLDDEPPADRGSRTLDEAPTGAQAGTSGTGSAPPRSAGATRDTATTGVAVAEPAPPAGPATVGATRPSARRGRPKSTAPTVDPETMPSTSPERADQPTSEPTERTATDRTAPAAAERTAADHTAATATGTPTGRLSAETETAEESVEATTVDRPARGGTTAPTTGPKTRPGRRGR